MYRQYKEKSREKDKDADSSINSHTRRHLLQLFPRIHIDPQKNNKLNFREQFGQFDQTPKNKRYKSTFEHKTYQQLNDQSLSIASKQTDKFRSKIKSPYKKTFTYQPVSISEGRSSTLSNGHKHQIFSKQRINTEPVEADKNLLISIEQNLFECDKILSKLKGSRLEQKNFKSSKKAATINWNRQVELPSSVYVMKQTIQNFNNISQISSKESQQQIRNNTPTQFLSISYNTPQNIDNESYSFQVKPARTKSIDSQSYGDIKMISSPNYIASQNSILEVRRQRINQIIKTNKYKLQNPLELSFNKMKQRGEKLFSKMIRAKETSNTEISYESDLAFQSKYRQ